MDITQWYTAQNVITENEIDKSDRLFGCVNSA